MHLFMPTAMPTSLADQTAWRSTKRLLPKQCHFVGCALNMLKSKRAALECRESFQYGCCKPLPELELSLSWLSSLSFRFAQKNSVRILRFLYMPHARPVSSFLIWWRVCCYDYYGRVDIYQNLTAVNTLLSPAAGAGALPDFYAHRYQHKPKNNITTTTVSPNVTSVPENNELYSRQSSGDAYLEEAGKAFWDSWLRHGSREWEGSGGHSEGGGLVVGCAVRVCVAYVLGNDWHTSSLGAQLTRTDGRTDRYELHLVLLFIILYILKLWSPTQLKVLSSQTWRFGNSCLLYGDRQNGKCSSKCAKRRYTSATLHGVISRRTGICIWRSVCSV